ncbi:MAG: TetR/AcrR family transcriptional regulator [Acetobacteraceae bacterium]|nr:TetR/AcrR family transcriptional regulator [Acetobacteraceae bacterium]
MRSISTDYLEQPTTPRRDSRTDPVRAMGEARNGYRPRLATIERSREIREISARLITSQGLWRFSMLSLARHLNCLLPTLCYYYKKREELITDIVLRHIETLRARTGLAIDETEDDSPSNELRAFAREYLLVALAEQDFHRVMVSYAGLAGPEEGRPFLLRQEVLREMVEGRLTAHAPALAGKPETARSLSRALLDTLSGAATWMEPYGVVKPVAYAAMVADWVLDQAARS